jgi:hypothetical protein
VADVLEVFHERRHAEGALLDVEGEGLQEHRSELARDARSAAQKLGELGTALAVVDRSVPVGQPLQDEELGDHQRERKEIGAAVGGQPAQLLGRSVRATGPLRAIAVGVASRPIDLHLTVERDEDPVGPELGIGVLVLLVSSGAAAGARELGARLHVEGKEKRDLERNADAPRALVDGVEALTVQPRVRIVATIGLVAGSRLVAPLPVGYGRRPTATPASEGTICVRLPIHFAV